MPIQQNPYIPAPPGPLIMDQFEGCNTSTTRAGVPDNQVYWFDGFMPLDKNNCRTLYDVGATLYTAPGGITIVFFGFVNISTVPYMILFQSDGSVVAVNVNTAAVIAILPAGSISTVNQLQIGLSQWGQQYAIIVANQTNGYWLWDGLITYAAGTIGPIVTLTHNGSGYVSQPIIGLVGGGGSGAVFTSSINNGSVVSVQISNPGTGYLVGDTPTLTFSGGNQSGSLATITVGLSHHAGGSGGAIVITLVGNPNSGYTAYPTLTADGSGYGPNVKVNVTGGDPFPSAGLKIKAYESAGALTSITYTGGGYQNSVVPTASITDTGYYFISSDTIVAGGQNYSNFPVLTFTVSSSANTITSSPVLTASVSGAGSSITSVSIVSGGQMTANVAPTVVITDTASTAAGTVTLMPYGVSGNAVETYSGHVWVASQNNYSWSAPGSVNDFATSDGGGSAQSADSYLKIGYTRLIQSNGFLYLIADSSIDYISGVQTAGTPPVTTFTKQNAAPTIGTPFPWSVILHGQDILFSNSIGTYIISGAQPIKVSGMLDGIWNAPMSGLAVSAAHQTIFNREVWMMLSTFVNPITNATVTQPTMWDGKHWFSSPQTMSIVFIDSLEINSVFTAYGTDGTIVAPLFNTPSNFTKQIQSKLWGDPGGYMLTKAPGRFWGTLDYYSISQPSITLFADAVYTDPGSGTISYNSAQYTIAGPAATGHYVIPPLAIGQQGILTGFTLRTNCADMAIVSVMMDDKPVSYRG
jgi:hypothetical protein